MNFNPIQIACQYLILHPEHEEDVLTSDDKVIEILKGEWREFNRKRLEKSYSICIGNHHIPISFSAFLMYKRIEMMKDEDNPFECIFSENTMKDIDCGYEKHALYIQYGFITDITRKCIDQEDEYTLYDISIDEAIDVQEDILFELIDLDVYSLDQVSDLFYHDQKKKYTHVGDGIYILHKWSVWNSSSGGSVILPYDLKAAIMHEGWTYRDFKIKYPNCIPISEEDLKEGADTDIGDSINEDVVIHMLERRPYLFTIIYPGTILSKRDIYEKREYQPHEDFLVLGPIERKKIAIEYRYAPRVYYMIDARKLPTGWKQHEGISYMETIEDPLYQDGIYGTNAIQDEMFTRQGNSYDIDLWKKPETIFTLGRHIKESYVDTCIICI